PTAYNVQIVSSTPDSPEIQFVRDSAQVGFRNSDLSSYTFAWKLRLNGRTYEGGQFHIPAQGTQWIRLEKPQPQKAAPNQPAGKDNDFPSAGYLTILKDEAVNGALILTPILSEPSDPADIVLTKELPAKFTFAFFDGILSEDVTAGW